MPFTPLDKTQTDRHGQTNVTRAYALCAHRRECLQGRSQAVLSAVHAARGSHDLADPRAHMSGIDAVRTEEAADSLPGALGREGRALNRLSGILGCGGSSHAPEHLAVKERVAPGSVGSVLPAGDLARCVHAWHACLTMRANLDAPLKVLDGGGDLDGLARLEIDAVIGEPHHGGLVDGPQTRQGRPHGWAQQVKVASPVVATNGFSQ